MIRGDIWMAALDPVRGSEQAGTRPVLVIQADSLNSFLRTAVVVPFTSNVNWARFSFCVLVSKGEGGLTSDSVALCHQIRVMDSSRLIRRLGKLEEATIAKIEQAINIAIGL